MKRRLTVVGLTAVVLGALALSLAWVFRVPMFQAPDEPQHFDYAMCLFEKGGLVRPSPLADFKDRLPYTNYYGLSFLCYFAHPYTTYLIDRCEHGAVSATTTAKVPPGYGSRSYWKAVNRGAPDRSTLELELPPSLAYAYPLGYYSLVAAWMGIIHIFTGNVVALFFGARILSVLLLAGSMLFSFATLRELHFSRRFSLLVTACIGFFPLTSFVSSYVQPDNLSFTLVSACFFLALRSRRAPCEHRWWALLGLALAALLITKPHYFLCVVTPCLATLAAEILTRKDGQTRRGSWLLLLAPSVLSASFCAWTMFGSGYNPLPIESPRNRTLFLLEGLEKAFHDFYASTTHHSFWGIFGWLDTPLVFRGVNTTAAIQIVVQATSWIMLGLTLIRLEQVVSRLIGLMRRGRWRWALRIAFSNPPINSYFLFTVFMFALHVATHNHFGGQGRNWFPLLLPIFLTGLVYAPKALTMRRVRKVFRTAAALGLASYCMAGSYYALATIQNRYYPPNYDRAMREVRFSSEPILVNQMKWKGRTGDGTGDDPFLVFKLNQPEFVYCVRLKYRLHNFENTPSFLQAFWMESGRNVFVPEERNSLFRIRTQEADKTLTVWINDRIDCFRLDPDTKPCHFEILDLKVLGKEDAPLLHTSTSVREPAAH